MPVLKYSPIHEQIFLGTCLRHDDIREKYIRQHDIEFGVEQHQMIWGGLQTMHERNLAYTPGTLETILPKEGWEGRKYLAQLANKAEPDNIEFHLQRMRWDITRLDLFGDPVAKLTNILKDPTESPESARKLLRQIAKSLDASIDDDPLVRNKQLVAKAQATIRARRVAGPNFRTSGFGALDKNLEEGFGDRRVSVIAATPSTGKTTIMLNLAREQAMNYGVSVGILAWEGGMQAALDTMCASGLKIKLPKLLKFAKKITDDEQSTIDDYIAELLGDDKIRFMKPPPKKLSHGAPWEVITNVLDWCEEQFIRWDVDVIYWDLFLKKIPASTPDQVTQALNRVQDMNNEDGGLVRSHICLLHQINLKIVEERKDKRPTRDVLKGTGAWVENPDLVLTAYRPAIHETGLEDNEIEITCWKQRRGQWPWRVVMDWDGMHGKISGGRNVSMRTIEQPDNERKKRFTGKV